MKNKTRATAALVSLAAAVGLAACGGDSGATDTDTNASIDDASLKFAQCMREHGIDLPDPEPGSAGISIDPNSGIDPTAPSFREAEDACAHYLEEAVASNDNIKQATGIPDGALDYAECMRDHGLDYPDPKLSASGPVAIGPPEGLDPDDPQVQTATQACQKFLEVTAEDAPTP